MPTCKAIGVSKTVGERIREDAFSTFRAASPTRVNVERVNVVFDHSPDVLKTDGQAKSGALNMVHSAREPVSLGRGGG